MFVLDKNGIKDKYKYTKSVVKNRWPLSLPLLPNKSQEEAQIVNHEAGSKASRVSTDEQRYRQDVLRTLLECAAGITLVIGFVYLVTFWQKPARLTLILSGVFLLFPLIVGWCLHLLRQERLQRAMQIFIASATVLATLFMLFMPDNLGWMGLMSIFVIVRVGTFLETPKALVCLGGLWTALYLVIVALRRMVDLPQVDLWPSGGFLWYIVPLAILVVFIRIDQTITHYLKEALLESESVRPDLAQSYARLERQKEKLEESEANLSVLAAKLAQNNQELQAVNEELDSFAYIAAHDIRTPLRAVRIYADFLSEDLAETLVGDQKRYIEGLVQAVYEAEDLVEDLLTFAKIGHQTLEIKTIDIEMLLRGLIASFNLPTDVEVEWAETWPMLSTEPSLLQQIFQNLIFNAIKFNHSSPKRIELGWRPAGEKGYELFVRDNGIGIAPRHQQQIFHIFRRLHTRQEYEGTGVGLAIVKKAARKLDASIRVESVPGQGSTFFVTLPKISERYQYAQATFRHSDG